MPWRSSRFSAASKIWLVPDGIELSNVMVRQMGRIGRERIEGFNIMKTISLLVSILTLASLASVPTVYGDGPATAAGTTDTALETPPAIPATPAAVDGIVCIRKFTLNEGFNFDWCKERPLVTTGYLLVLKVNPALVYPRQQAEPVLYVGKQSAQRLNVGYKSGHVVAMIPGEPDWAKTLIWFGKPDLPERVDSNVANTEEAAAKAAGIKPFSAKELETAFARGSKSLKASNVDGVLGVAADLIRQHSPDEAELTNTLVPAPKPAAKPVSKPGTDNEE